MTRTLATEADDYMKNSFKNSKTRIDYSVFLRRMYAEKVKKK